MKTHSKIQSSRSSFFLATILAATSLTQGCGRSQSKSKLDVTDVEHTPVKRQSIGNCWLYATSTWTESLHLAATGETVNISESYWTYWDWYNKIRNSTDTKINTGGSWHMASRIIAEHGYMLEADFIPDEADEQMSEHQRNAEASINEALSTGSLKSPADRTEENILRALDAAFEVDMNAARQLAHAASELKTSPSGSATTYTLADEIAGGRHAWTTLYYPQVYGQGAEASWLEQRARTKALKRALKAVNDKHPVIMSSMVEFAALNTENNATFEYDLYLKTGHSTGQGGHLIVLEDYVVDNVPGVGSIGEGDVSAELKDAALNGDVRYLVVKNSWGTNRPDRGLSDGYTRFNMDFLNRPLPFDLEHGDSDITHGNWYSALSSFIVPPEY